MGGLRAPGVGAESADRGFEGIEMSVLTLAHYKNAINEGCGNGVRYCCGRQAARVQNVVQVRWHSSTSSAFGNDATRAN
jgi:hypothetical protein